MIVWTPAVEVRLRRASSVLPVLFQTSTLTGAAADKVTDAWYRPGGRRHSSRSAT
jgi:hypothetical protein